MGQRKKIRINKLLTFSIWICVFLLIVVAGTPSIPNQSSPANNTKQFSDNATLIATGLVGGDIFQFRVNGVITDDADGTLLTLGLSTGATNNWSVRAKNISREFNMSITQGTVIHYYELESDPVIDSVGTLNSTSTNGTIVPGKINNSIEFDGVSELANFPSEFVDEGANFTIGGWIFPDVVTGTHKFVGQTETDSVNSGFSVGTLEDTIVLDLHGLVRINTSETLGTAGWTHIVYVYNATGVVKSQIWINATRATINDETEAILTGATDRIAIGSRGTANDFWNGKVDEVFAINDTINQSIIEAIYNSGDGLSFNQGFSNFTGDRQIHVMNFVTGDTDYSSLAINYTIKDEQTGNVVTDTDFNPIFNLNTNVDSKGFTFTPGVNSTFPYNLDPAGQAATAAVNITYSAGIYPQRTFTSSGDIFNSSSLTEKTLYLLNSTEGAFVSFQVVDIGGAVIPGTLVTASKTISSQVSVVSSGITDSAGLVTFWLDPTTTHTLVASKAGFPTTTVSIEPTQSTFTIILGSTGEVNQTSPFFGITYNILPIDSILNNNTVTNFTFNITSTFWNLSSYGFTLRNSTGGELNATSDNNPAGSPTSVLLDTNNLTSITMDYFWLIDGNFSNQSQTWNIRPTFQGDLSIKTFFDNLANFAASGFDDFGRIIISIIIIVLVAGSLAFFAGVTSPQAISGVVVFLVFLLESVNFMPVLVRKYLLSVMLVVVWIGFLIQENSR